MMRNIFFMLRNTLIAWWQIQFAWWVTHFSCWQIESILTYYALCMKRKILHDYSIPTNTFCMMRKRLYNDKQVLNLHSSEWILFVIIQSFSSCKTYSSECHYAKSFTAYKMQTVFYHGNCIAIMQNVFLSMENAFLIIKNVYLLSWKSVSYYGNFIYLNAKCEKNNCANFCPIWNAIELRMIDAMYTARYFLLLRQYM